MQNGEQSDQMWTVPRVRKMEVNPNMKAVKWLDEHAEEVILIFLLILISCVELLQVVCRNVPTIPALTWAEETCRFFWIMTVFISLPYTIRTATTLRVTALLEILPWKVQNILNIVIDIITAGLLAFMGYHAVLVNIGVFENAVATPATNFPLWILYIFISFGFIAGALRAVQMTVIHIKNIDVKPLNSVEEAASFELASADIEVQQEVTDEALTAAWTNNGNPTTERSDA